MIYEGDRNMVEKGVFLDIDGLLQTFTQYRFDHIGNGDMENAYEGLRYKKEVDYRKYDIYDVAAVYYDWDSSAVNELKRVMEITGAKFVLSSSAFCSNNCPANTGTS